ncbi:MAG: hypothetical protein AAB116_17920 [Candidatus Poribacteria bacterium]
MSFVSKHLGGSPPSDPIIREFPDRSIRWLLETPDNLRGLLLTVAKDLAKRIDYTRTELLNRTFILDYFLVERQVCLS